MYVLDPQMVTFLKWLKKIKKCVALCKVNISYGTECQLFQQSETVKYII